MSGRRGVALISVLLLLLTATALAHGALLLARAELTAAAERTRRAEEDAATAGRLASVLDDPFPEDLSGSSIWEERLLDTGFASGGVARIRRLAPESWWLELAPDSAGRRRTGTPGRLLWWMDPLTRLREIGAVLTVGAGAPLDLPGVVERAGFALTPTVLDDVGCGFGQGPVDFLPDAVRMLPEGVERPALGLLSFDTLLAMGPALEGRGTPAPADDAGTCQVGEPWNWGDPERPGAPCQGHVAVRSAPSGLRVDGGVGHVVLVVDGDLELAGDVRLHGFVLATGTLMLREEAELHGMGIGVRGVTVAPTSRVHGSACWASSALAAARGRWMPAPWAVPGVPPLGP